MSAAEATAEVFVTAFKGLKPKRRAAVMERILADKQLAEDAADTLLHERRRPEPARPLTAVNNAGESQPSETKELVRGHRPRRRARNRSPDQRNRSGLFCDANQRTNKQQFPARSGQGRFGGGRPERA